jgi:hypothetical protein
VWALTTESTLKTSTVVRLAVLWNDTVVSEQVINPKKGIHIGSDKKSQLKIPDHGAIQGKYQLFAPGSPDSPELQLDSKMTGWLQLGAERTELGGHKPSYLLNEGDYGVVKVIDEDANRLAVFFKVLSEEPSRFAAPLMTSIESRFFAAFLFAMTLHLGVLITAFALKNYELALANVKIDDRFTEVLTEKAEDDMPEEPVEEEEEEDDVGKQAGGEEGKFGQEDKLDKSKVPTTDGEMVDKIKNVGLAKALSSSLMGRGALSSVFGNRDGFSDQLNAAMSGGDGELVMGHGAGGMGLRGTGSGGGGSGFGRIHGMGKIDTGGGRGTKARLGRRGKRKARFTVKKGAPSVGNFCKQADILRVVSARQKAITYCYEKQLASNPELGGKVTLSWIINLDGTVKKIWVKGSSLKNGKVESCMTRTLKRARFTKPDGGMCQIQFPFVFNSGI